MISPQEKGKEIFSTGYNCSQSVFKAILDYKGLFFNNATYITAGFGGGMGMQGEVCGALTGAIMAIGLLNAERIKDPIEHKKATYKLVENFLVNFKEKRKTLLCRELVGFEIKNETLRKKASDEGLFQRICPSFIVDAITIVLDMFPD